MAKIIGKVTNKSSYFTFYIEYSLTMNVEGNYHDLIVATYIQTSNTSQTFDTVGVRDHSITVESETKPIQKRIDCSPWGDNPLKIQEETFRIYHNDDGTKKITISARSNGTASSYGYSSSLSSSGDATASAEIELPTIPRASSFGTVTGDTIGSAITININRHSNSFTHSLWYSFGSKTWQGIASNVGTSQPFTPPLSLCSEIPNTTSGELVLILRTYLGNTQIGSDVYKPITVNVPSSVVPTIGGITVSENVSEIASKAGVYLQKLSRLNLAIANASGAYGSTIKSYQITFEGATWTAQSAVSGYIKGSGNLVITGEITDSRGRKATRQMTIAVAPYDYPAFNYAPSGERHSDDLTNVDITASGFVTSVKNGTIEKNAIKVFALPKLISSQYFPSISDTYEIHNTSDLSFEITKVISNIASDKSYDIRIVIQDNFKQTYWDLELSTEKAIGEINRKGWGINKRWERGGLDVLGDIYMNNEKVVTYEVGSVYMNTTNTNPSELLGGTWTYLSTLNDNIYMWQRTA